MTTPTTEEPPVTLDDLIRYVDELANVATPTPASSRSR